MTPNEYQALVDARDLAAEEEKHVNGQHVLHSWADGAPWQARWSYLEAAEKVALDLAKESLSLRADRDRYAAMYEQGRVTARGLQDDLAAAQTRLAEARTLVEMFASGGITDAQALATSLLKVVGGR